MKNFLAFFAMWSFVVAIREKKCRNITLIGSYTLIYALIIAFSFAVTSERYHFPVVPGFVLLSAFAMTHFRRKDFRYFYVYSTLLILAIVAWNYFKLAGRGLFL